MPLTRCHNCGQAREGKCNCWETKTRRCPRCGQTCKGRCPCSEQRRNNQPQRKQNQKLYNSRRWKYTRKLVLERDEYTCQHCGKLVSGLDAQVDHKQGLAAQGAELDMANLQTLCSACHGAKTARE